MRSFGGLSVEETAEVLKASPDTVKRDWEIGVSMAISMTRGCGCECSELY
jgi:hypothetical protein